MLSRKNNERSKLKKKLFGSKRVHRRALSNFMPTIINTEWYDSQAEIESSSDESNMVERDV